MPTKRKDDETYIKLSQRYNDASPALREKMLKEFAQLTRAAASSNDAVFIILHFYD